MLSINSLSRRTKPGMAILVFVLLSAPVALPVNAQDNSQNLDTNATLTVNTDAVETGSFARYLTLNGTINAWQEVVIAPEVGGYRVEEVLVDVGDYVEAGQELVRLSGSLLQADYSAKRATLKQLQAEHINAQLALDRAKTIAEKSLLSKSDLDRLNSEALSAEARREGAIADLEAAQMRLDYTRVVSPDAGVISSRTITVGQLAQAGTEMLRLLRQNRVEWRGEVPESSLPSLRVGQVVTVTSVDGREHQGTIRVVSPTVDTNTHNGLVYVDVPTDEALRPGMFARGKIEFTASSAQLIPLTSLVSSDGYNYVFVVGADRHVRRQMIETGVIQGNSIEVIKGLQTGDNIVTKGAGFLKDGDLVNVVEAN
ncbi:MAG: efflux RND transporter periplasmic adaptor subunit [Pseudomonadota bacterium]